MELVSLKLNCIKHRCSITSTVSANTTAGFSIAKFTGTGANATIGHGLSSAPELIIEKGLDATLNWKVYHKSIGAGKYLNFDESNGSVSATVTWNNTAPTSSVFSVGSGNNNNSGQDYIAYCFHSVNGYSKVIHTLETEIQMVPSFTQVSDRDLF